MKTLKIADKKPILKANGVKQYRFSLKEQCKMLLKESMRKTDQLSKTYDTLKKEATKQGWTISEYRNPKTGEVIIEVMPPKI